MGRVAGPYEAEFPIGTIVRVADREGLERFQREWRFHHPLGDEQLEFGGCVALVLDVGYYHGGDELYRLEGIPGTWHEVCLAAEGVRREDVKPPLFVIDGDDLMLCRSLETLEAFVEPPDAAAACVFDAEGRVLALRAITHEPRALRSLRRWLPRRRCTRALPTATIEPRTLEAALKRILSPLDAEIRQRTLEEIVASIERFGIRDHGETR
jgi:hypothetical protein